MTQSTCLATNAFDIHVEAGKNRLSKTSLFINTELTLSEFCERMFGQLRHFETIPVRAPQRQRQITFACKD